MATFPEEGRKNELLVVGGVGGANLYVHLFTNAVLVDKDTRLDQLAKPTWSGYTAYHSTAWSEPYIDVNGDAVILSPVFTFSGPAILPGGTAQGFFVTIGDGAEAKLWMVERFASPKLLESPTDQIPLRVEARLRYPA